MGFMLEIKIKNCTFLTFDLSLVEIVIFMYVGERNKTFSAKSPTIKLKKYGIYCEFKSTISNLLPKCWSYQIYSFEVPFCAFHISGLSKMLHYFLLPKKFPLFFAKSISSYCDCCRFHCNVNLLSYLSKLLLRSWIIFSTLNGLTIIWILKSYSLSVYDFQSQNLDISI